MNEFLARFDGYKSYILLLVLFGVTLWNDTPAGQLDLAELVDDPQLLQDTLVIAIVAAFRSALSKLTG